MILTAHQPGYLPWIGLFDKISQADTFCFFDIAQYQTKEFDNRNRIKTKEGELWLSVPVESKNHFNKKLNEIKIIQNGWQRKHLKSIEIAYCKAKFFSKYFDEISAILNKKHTFLVDLNIDFIMFFLEKFDIKVDLIRASNFDFNGQKSSLVLDMCMKLGAKKYIFGVQGKNYADIDSFKMNNIEILFQNYTHPEYHQLYGNFISHLSSLDLLFNMGDDSKKILINS